MLSRQKTILSLTMIVTVMIWTFCVMRSKWIVWIRINEVIFWHPNENVRFVMAVSFQKCKLAPYSWTALRMKQMNDELRFLCQKEAAYIMNFFFKRLDKIFASSLATNCTWHFGTGWKQQKLLLKTFQKVNLSVPPEKKDCTQMYSCFIDSLAFCTSGFSSAIVLGKWICCNWVLSNSK